MENFTPVSALAGGALIGLSAAVLVLFAGRVAGISGIIGGMVSPGRGETTWRLAFLIGMMSAPLLYLAIGGPLPEVSIDVPMPLLVAAGLIVGFGTRLGSGCTSGHGVCGLARLSPRSIAATLTFMAAAFGTVFVTRHLFGA